ncbi:MAG: hypothetical protein RL449_1406, partial [Bacteroidota bacterium]
MIEIRFSMNRLPEIATIKMCKHGNNVP